MSGATHNVGSIEAVLKVDDSDFKRGMAEAKTEAKEVGALEPKVKVDANVGPALAKLEAVAKAERDLDIAFQRSTIAQEKLDIVTQKYGEDSIRAASARLALTRATNAESDAEAKLAVRRERSTEAQDAETESTKAGVRANRDRVSGLQVLMALAPGILAAAAPIAGAATGLAVGFGVMGLSGVLALKGIKDAMVVGDTVGNQYASGLIALKGDLDALAATSANGMLGAFNQSVGDINTKMPFLTQMVGEGSVALGHMGGTALRGVLDGLQTMNPLLQDGEVELGKFVTWLFSFNGTTGFQDFIGYSKENLPSVMHLLENLVITAGHILSAYAPLGPVMINLLTGLTDGLNSIPLPVLAGLVTTATLLGPALRMAFAPGVSTLIISVAEAIGFTGVMANLAVPVVGILTAAIAGIGIAAATSAIGTNQGRIAAQDYTQALKDDTNAIGEHVRAQAAKALSDAGAFDAARQLGVSIKDVTAAAEGNTDAMSRVKAATDAASAASMGGVAGHRTATEAQIANGDAAKTLAQAIGGTNGAIQDGIQKNRDYAEATRVTSGDASAQTAALQLQANQYGVTVQSVQAAKDAEDKAAQSTAEATAKMQQQSDAAGILKAALDGLNGKAMSAAQAQNAFDSSLANMGDHVDKTGKKITFTTTSIGDMSAASVALRGQLNGQVANLMQVVEANGGLQNSTGKAKEQMEAMRQQIIDNAVAHGVDKDAVTQYVDNLLTIPDSVPPTKVDIDKAEAEKKLQGFQSAINSLTGKTVDIYSVTHIQEVRDGPAVNGISGNAIANSMNAANQYAQDNAYNHADGGEILYRAGGGGVPFRPSGTDTVPAMLTPGEVVINRASVQSLGLGNVLQANRTGRWPQQGSSFPSSLTLVVDGREFTAYVAEVADGRVEAGLDSVARQVGGMRR